MSRPIIARINGSALQHNLKIVRNAAPTAYLWSVIKANAYGHRIDLVWKSLSNTDGFALLDLEEALFLRQSGWKKPILLLEGFFHPNDIPLLDHYRLTTSIHSKWQIKALEKAQLSAPLDIYVKMNSGMNRLGFHPKQIYTIWDKLRSLTNVRSMILMTHFAQVDSSDAGCIEETFMLIKKIVKKLNCLCSLANSAATLWHPKTHQDWIRSGIILYGASPSGDWKDIASSGLQAVMTLNTTVIAIQTLKVGAKVGYGSNYCAKNNHRIGVIACGYADGYPRHAPTGTPVMVDGIITHTVGTISMDMITVDLTRCPQAKVGSKVELWGNNIKIDDVAKASGTLGYELMCSLACRVPCLN